MTELLLDWHDPFLTVEEQDGLLGWHLGVSLLTSNGICKLCRVYRAVDNQCTSPNLHELYPSSLEKEGQAMRKWMDADQGHGV